MPSSHLVDTDATLRSRRSRLRRVLLVPRRRRRRNCDRSCPSVRASVCLNQLTFYLDFLSACGRGRCSLRTDSLLRRSRSTGTNTELYSYGVNKRF